VTDEATTFWEETPAAVEDPAAGSLDAARVTIVEDRVT
jgi:hypothetical protein